VQNSKHDLWHNANGFWLKCLFTADSKKIGRFDFIERDLGGFFLPKKVGRITPHERGFLTWMDPLASHSRARHYGKLGIPDSPTSIYNILKFKLSAHTCALHLPVMHIDSDSGFDEELSEVSREEKPDDELDWDLF